MRKKIFCFLLLLPLVGCESDLSYDGQTRVMYEGTVLNAEGQPLTGVPVGIYITKNGYFYSLGYDSDLISYTRTGAGGHFRMVFPLPENEDNISLLINKQAIASPDPVYSSMEIYNIGSENLSGYKIDFGVLKLYKVENSVTLSITVSPQASQVSKLNITGLADNNVIDFNLQQPRDENDNHFLPLQSQVAKNQTILLRYQLANGLTGERQVQINEQPVEYVLEL